MSRYYDCRRERDRSLSHRRLYCCVLWPVMAEAAPYSGDCPGSSTFAGDHVALLKPLRERRTAPIFEPGFIESLTSWATTIGNILQVFVRDNNVEQALRALKKKMQREGIFREMKRRKAYEKPSERKTREKAEAIRRARKAARKLAQREGLIPLPKRREPAPRRARLLRSF